MEYPRAGAHYPRSTGEFLAWFRTDEDCLDYLEWLRWPGGFACPHCGHAGGWRLADGRVECGGCSRRTSVTAGTIFDKTRTPLTVWFHACWLFATAKDGISAQYLQRSLEIGSYQTAWAMLHRLRSALVRPGRDRLAGTVEVDETFIGGEEHGLRGGRQPGKKVLTGIAVEISEPKGIGRCRMAVLADASAASLRPFVAGNVEPGSRVITDGWVGYNGLASRGYDHERRNQKAAARRGEDPGDLLPAVHRVASLCKRWLLGTHQGRVAPAHLPAYLNEFTFRFNRRHSRSRGLVFYRVLELAAGHNPVRYHDIRATKKPRGKPPAQRGTGHPPSLDRTAAARPWRTAEMQLQFPLRLSGYPGERFHFLPPDERRLDALAVDSGQPDCREHRLCLQFSEGPGEFAEGVGEPEVLGVVDRAGDHQNGFAARAPVRMGSRSGTDPVAPGPKVFRVGREAGVGEAGGDVVAEFQLHLPPDQPVGVILPDQHGQRDALAQGGLDLLGVHQECAIAGRGQHPAAGLSQLGADGTGQGKCHGGQAVGGGRSSPPASPAARRNAAKRPPARGRPRDQLGRPAKGRRPAPPRPARSAPPTAGQAHRVKPAGDGAGRHAIEYSSGTGFTAIAPGRRWAARNPTRPIAALGLT